MSPTECLESVKIGNRSVDLERISEASEGAYFRVTVLIAGDKSVFTFAYEDAARDKFFLMTGIDG